MYKEKDIRITPVTKGVCGSLEIARLFSNHEIHSIGDSHIQNIIEMKRAGIDTKFLLLRSPMKHEIEDVILNTDFCMTSEVSTIADLNEIAIRYNKTYLIIVMIELGDRREGVLPSDLDEFIHQIFTYKNIHLAGIGSNLVCLNGIKPTVQKMSFLSELATHIQKKFSCNLDIISGGSSANYQWFKEGNDPGMINHLRIGESILLGTDPISQSKINGLETNAFVLSIEVIESKIKPSMPEGIPTYTAFGDIPEIKDEGEMNRAILAIGLQDLDIRGCISKDKSIRIVGATSDHMVVMSSDRLLKVGEIVQFNLTYRAMLRLMISPYIEKKYNLL